MPDPTLAAPIASELAQPFINLAVDLYIKPRVQELIRAGKGRNATSLTKTFEEYLNRAYQKYAYFPILVFQNQQRLLEEVYVPLTVRLNGEHEEFKITSYSDNFIPAYNRVLLSDTAGMGKSTLLRKLFLSCLEQYKGIPIFVELRKLKREETIVEFVVDALNAINKEFDPELVMNLIADGNFVFFFDGYDEISRDDKKSVVRNLHNFIDKAQNNKFILTSRPDPSLSAFPGFMEFDIRPLDKTEAYGLIQKYDPSGEIASSIIKRLKGEDGKRVGEFLTNPLLVSLLFKGYEYKRTIPIRKSNFYRQVFDALYENHDLTKDGWASREKACGLLIDDFHAVLRGVGFKSLRHGVEYAKDELLSLIKAARIQMGLPEFSDSAFLDDLLKAVPIISRDGNSYRWSHKSLQDYFAAQFIWLDSDTRKEAILREMMDSQENWTYVNIFDLFADVDPKTYRRVVIRDAALAFIKHLKGTWKEICSDKGVPDDQARAAIRTLSFGVSILAFGKELSKDLQIDPNFFFVDRRRDELKNWLSKKGVDLKPELRLFHTLLWDGNFVFALRDKYELHSSIVFSALEMKIERLAIVKGKLEFPAFIALTDKKLVVETDKYFDWPSLFSEIAILRYGGRKPLPIVRSKDLQKLVKEIDAEIKLTQGSDFFEKL